MQYVGAEIPSRNHRRAVERVVFDDLTDDELSQFDGCLLDIHDKLYGEEMPVPKTPKAPKIPKAAKPRVDHDSEIEEALLKIDCDVDLTEYSHALAERNYNQLEPFRTTSCLNPLRNPTPEEVELRYSFSAIKHDCDQVRAMIARFLRYGNWRAFMLRSTFDNMDNKKSLTFLNHRGPKAGIRTNAFHLAWEFFKMRELFGVPLPEKPTSPESNKRERDVLSEQSTNAASSKSKKPNVCRSASVEHKPVYLIDD